MFFLNTVVYILAKLEKDGITREFIYPDFAFEHLAHL